MIHRIERWFTKIVLYGVLISNVILTILIYTLCRVHFYNKSDSLGLDNMNPELFHKIGFYDWLCQVTPSPLLINNEEDGNFPSLPTPPQIILQNQVDHKSKQRKYFYLYLLTHKIFYSHVEFLRHCASLY